MRTATLVLSIVIAAAVIATAFVGGFWYQQHRSAAHTTLPVLGNAPTYTLTNQLAQPVAASSFRGKVQLVTFLSPYCTGYCPLIALHLASLEKALEAGGLAGHVQFVAFNVDPEGRMRVIYDEANRVPNAELLATISQLAAGE
jgi:cytochrome oxidase Cu insertion factor (SCO1/SenC/PrrC family)